MIANPHFSSTFSYRDITALSVLLIMLLLLFFGELPGNSLFWRELQNSAHTPVFALIAAITISILQTRSIFLARKPFKLYITAFAISLLTGVGIELLQLLMHREASVVDIMRDLAGIIVGLGLYASVDPEFRRYSLMSGKRLRTGVVMLCCCVFIASMLPLAYLSAAYMQRKAAFPVVFELSSNWIRPFLRLNNATIKPPEDNEIRVDGENRLSRIDLKRGAYPGISIIETAPDWSAYKTLKIVVHSKLTQPFELVLRIHDNKHDYTYDDRFNKAMTINKGSNYFYIPLEDIKNSPANREMNMTQIREMTIFSTQSFDELYFYLGAARLE